LGDGGTDQLTGSGRSPNGNQVFLLRRGVSGSGLGRSSKGIAGAQVGKWDIIQSIRKAS
jgi:hypothetical protein